MLRRNLYRGAAGLLALLVALYVARATMARLRALTEPVPVVVARTVIPPYTAIAPGMVEVVYLPRGTVPQPVYTDPAEVVGRLARLELLPGVPIQRAYAVPAAELRYTADARSVILGVTVAAVRVPGDLLLPGHRVDVWQADRLVGPGLRVVAISRLPEGKWVVALESPQELVPALLAASGQTRCGADLVAPGTPGERAASLWDAECHGFTVTDGHGATDGRRHCYADSRCGRCQARSGPGAERARGAGHRVPGLGDLAGRQPPDAGGARCRGTVGPGVLRGR